MRIAVTGALSYSGKYIARRLLARGASLITLTGHPNRPDPFGGQIPGFPLQFDRPGELEKALSGCEVLVNTYWVRFDRGSNTQRGAVENTRRLITAAARAGVRRIIHISITNPSADCALPYFRGKAWNEKTVVESGLSYAILRPTVLFWKEDILINNIAFLLRRFPVFLIPGAGEYRLQPVYVDDLAEMAEAAVYVSESFIQDAVGEEVFTFRGLVELIGATIGHRRPLLSVPVRWAWHASRLLGLLFGDVLLTRDEVDGLMANLLVSSEPPGGKTRLSEWLLLNRRTLGAHYSSELQRHYD